MKKSRWSRIKGSRQGVSGGFQDWGHLWFCYHKKFFGALINRGLKLKAHNRFLQLLMELKKREGVEPTILLTTALLRIAPEIQLKYFRRGRKLQPYVVGLTATKKVSFAVRWTVKLLADQQRNNNVPVKLLADNICLAVRNKGASILRKKMTYQIAAANRHVKPFFWR